jgi:hypothetical protein
MRVCLVRVVVLLGVKDIIHNNNNNIRRKRSYLLLCLLKVLKVVLVVRDINIS